MSDTPGTRTVRTTMSPDEDLTVGDAEYADLQRQGLLIETDLPAASSGHDLRS